MSDRFFIPQGLDEADQGDEQIDVANYQFPGPKAEVFAYSSGFIDLIQGPYGSGKTTAVFFRCLRRANAMPICRDGWRRYRVIVLRDTYRRMKETAIKSWHKWFPPSVGQWTGGQDRPSEHVLEFEDLDGVPTRFEIKFAAVGDLDIEDFMGGLETTDLVLNEANLLNQDVLTYGLGRTGRYPSIKDLPDDLPIRNFPGYTLGHLPPGLKLAQLPPQALFDHGVFGDCNAPEFDSWLLQMQFGDIIDAGGRVLGRTNFFVQPGGRSPGAENLDNLPAGYYDMLAAANAHQSWWVSRMIDNKPGYSRHGKPVYEEYNDELHASKEPLRIIPSLPLLWAFDAGLHPAALAAQWLPDGQFRILKEFYLGHCGPTRFGEQVRTWMDQHARDVVSHRGWSDPTAFDGVDKLSGEQSWVQIVQAITGIHIEPAPSNEPTLRQDAVRQAMTYMIDGTKPGLLVDPGCKLFRKGAASNYRYIKIRSDIGDTFAEKPHKDEWSNLQDCGQYLMLGARGKAGVISRRTGQRPNAARRGGTVQVKTEFSVF
jgi:hypothetical protein